MPLNVGLRCAGVSFPRKPRRVPARRSPRQNGKTQMPTSQNKRELFLVVVFQSEVRDQFFALQVAESVL